MSLLLTCMLIIPSSPQSFRRGQVRKCRPLQTSTPSSLAIASMLRSLVAMLFLLPAAARPRRLGKTPSFDSSSARSTPTNFAMVSRVPWASNKPGSTLATASAHVEPVWGPLRFTSLTMPPQVRWPLAWALQSRWLMTIRRCALLGVMRRDLVLQHTFPCKCRVSYMLLASDIRYAYAVSEQGVLNVIDWQNVSNPQAHLNLGCQGGSQVCQLHEAVCWLCACCCHADLQRCCLIWPTTLLAPS